MTVKLTYVIKQEIVVLDMSPQEYCNLYANSNYGDYFPKKSYERNIEVMDEESENELDDFFFKKT